MLLEKIRDNLEIADKLCYLSKSKSYTYSELGIMVKKIYAYLKKENIKGKVVCVGHKEVEMLASFLACSFAGITYVPVDVSIPEDRLEYILKDTNPSLVLDYNKIEKILTEEGDMAKNIKLEINIKPEDVYYTIYTSGSTGRPKGVEITYDNLESFINWFTKLIGIKDARVLNQALFSFDLSVADIYFSLYNASTLCITETSFMYDAKELYDQIRNLNVNIMIMTPSYANLLLTDKCFNESLNPNLEIMYFCGETLTRKTVERLKERFNNICIINSYGPTECTVAVTAVDVTKTIEERLPVGTVKEDTEIFILDENGNETLDVGEIVISGRSVGKGYLNIETDKFFMYKDKWSYRTGDLGYIKDNMLYFNSRKDSQIKYLGYRVELEDITNNILNVDGVENAVTFTKENEEKVVNKIISCVQLKEKCNISIKEITCILKRKLPAYMIPTIKIVDRLELNSNGKIDKKQMEEMYSGRKVKRNSI